MTHSLSAEELELLVEGPDCAVCGRAITDIDPWCLTRDFSAEGGIAACHKACTREGVWRWNREGRPYGDPLEAARELRWAWSASEREGRYARPGHTATNRLRDAREGRLKFAPDPTDS